MTQTKRKDAVWEFNLRELRVFAVEPKRGS
jgi:hypothetical protein